MIPDLETCPSCPFSYIPDDNSLVFECQEDSCKKVSCRFVTTTLSCLIMYLCLKHSSKCKEPNHLPLKCEEVEKDEEIQARRQIEERMTEALVRFVVTVANLFTHSGAGTESLYSFLESVHGEQFKKSNILSYEKDK